MNSVQVAINSQEEMSDIISHLYRERDLYRGGYLTLEKAQFEGETNRITLEINVISHSP